MKNILIIGADSFIASKFILSNQGNYNIIGYSRKKIDYCEYIISPDFFDVKDSYYKWADIILNFAAIVHQPKLDDDLLYKKVNTGLPVYLAEKSYKFGIKHLIQMSTIAVYGNVNLINEKTIEKPENIYGSSKLEADKVLLSMQNNNLKISIIRPPMVYGGGKAPGNLLKLISFAQKGIPLPFKGIDNKRDFIHVQNLIQILNVVIEKKILGIIIPTDKKSVSTEKIIMLIQQNSNKEVRQIKIPKFGQISLKKIIPNIYTKVFGDLNVVCNISDDLYMPEYGIEEGIKEMLEELK